MRGRQLQDYKSGNGMGWNAGLYSLTDELPDLTGRSQLFVDRFVSAFKRARQHLIENNISPFFYRGKRSGSSFVTTFFLLEELQDESSFNQKMASKLEQLKRKLKKQFKNEDSYQAFSDGFQEACKNHFDKISLKREATETLDQGREIKRRKSEPQTIVPIQFNVSIQQVSIFNPLPTPSSLAQQEFEILNAAAILSTLK